MPDIVGTLGFIALFFSLLALLEAALQGAAFTIRILNAICVDARQASPESSRCQARRC